MQDYATSLSEGHIARLREIFGEDLLLGAEQMFVYGSDASLLRGQPLAVVRPQSVSQVQQVMSLANDIRLPVYVRGRGTNLVGDCVPIPPGLVISTLKMDRICDISRQDFVAEVEPGVCTATLQAACEAQGLYYPPDPATVKASSIGGNVVTCAGGMRALKYGVTRDFVLGMELVVPGGKVLHLGGRTHKNVVGLDLSRLVVGSEGTLGFVSRLWLKLLPKPEASASLLVGFPSCAEALTAVSDIFAAGILPCALEFVGEAVVRLMAENTSRLGSVPWPGNVHALLVIRMDGSRQCLAGDIHRLKQCIASALWHEDGMDAQAEERIWEIRRRINPAAFLLAPDKASDDVTVPRGSILLAVQEMEEIAGKHGVTMLDYGHVGDGNIHVNLMYDSSDPAQKKAVSEVKHAINLLVLGLGGTMSGEHGCGMVKDASLQLGADELLIMQGVKRVFDPLNIMNPGKGY